MLRTIKLSLLLTVFAGAASAGVTPSYDDGFIDTSFGDNGRTRVEYTGVDAFLGGMVSTGANRTFMVGALQPNDSATVLLVARLSTSTGLLDPTFGLDNNGKRMTDLPAGLRAPVVYAVTKDTNGLVLAAGTIDNGTAVDPAFVCRFFQAGNLDPNFGTNGCKTIRTFLAGEQICRARALSVDASGNIVVAGYCEGVVPFSRPFIARLTSTGALDVNFAGGAGVATPLLSTPGMTNEQRFNSVLVTPAGQIVVAATARHTAGDNDMAIAQFTDGGSFDTAFNLTGERVFAFDLGNGATNREDYASEILRRPDGRLLLVGRSRYTLLHGKVTMASVLADGSDDPQFGTDSTRVDERPLFNVFATPEWLTSRRTHAVLDDVGRLLVATFTGNPAGDTDDVIRRYRPDGSDDLRFGDAGDFTRDHQTGVGGVLRSEDAPAAVIVSGSRVLVASGARRPSDHADMFIAYALQNGEIFRDSFE